MALSESQSDVTKHPLNSKPIPQIDFTNNLALIGRSCSVRIRCQTFTVVMGEPDLIFWYLLLYYCVCWCLLHAECLRSRISELFLAEYDHVRCQWFTVHSNYSSYCSTAKPFLQIHWKCPQTNELSHNKKPNCSVICIYFTALFTDITL